MNGTTQRETGTPRVEDLRRGDVWYVRLGSVSGGGLSKIIPCIIIQIDELNISGALDTVLVVPLSTQTPPEDEQTDYDIVYQPDETGLPRACSAIWTQVRSLSPKRLVNRTGHLDKNKLERLSFHLGTLIGITGDSFE